MKKEWITDVDNPEYETMMVAYTVHDGLTDYCFPKRRKSAPDEPFDPMHYNRTHRMCWDPTWGGNSLYFNPDGTRKPGR